CGSTAGRNLAWPKPDHTGVVGEKLWVRSTSCLPAIMRWARARSFWACAGTQSAKHRDRPASARTVEYRTRQRIAGLLGRLLRPRCYDNARESAGFWYAPPTHDAGRCACGLLRRPLAVPKPGIELFEQLLRGFGDHRSGRKDRLGTG